MKLISLVLGLAALVYGTSSSHRLVPARFQRGHGWHVASVCVRPRCSAALSRAATVRWRDCWDCLPPNRTLDALPAEGIAIYLQLNKNLRGVGARMKWPPRISGKAIARLELTPSRVGGFVTGGRLQHLAASLWVFFGRRHPTARQIARAEAELRSARLP